MKKIFSLLLVIAILLIPMTAMADDGVIEITIPSYRTGENVGAIFFLPQIERFNAKYEGKYHVVIEEINEQTYGEKMRQLAMQGKLPPIISGGCDDTFMTEVAIPNNMFRDLTPFLAAHPEIDELIPDYQREYNTTADGKYVSIGTNVVRPTSMYYNSALTNFTKEPGEYADWDELLADFGDNKIAFMTGENAWTSALVISAIFGLNDEAVEVLREHCYNDNKMTDWTASYFVEGFAKFAEIYQKYGTSNTIGAVYADAANDFMSNGSAIIANGPWMAGDFSAANGTDKWSNDFDGSTVVGAVFPGNIALSNPTGGTGWWIPSTISEEEAEAAEALLAFMCSKEEVSLFVLAEGGNPANFVMDEAIYDQMAIDNPTLASYTKAANPETKMVPSILDAMPSSVASTTFGAMLPQLLDGTVTAEQFCANLSQACVEAIED